MKDGARRHVTGHDVIVLILLQNFDIVKDVLSASETLDKPGAFIGPVAENLALDLRLAPIFLFAAQDSASREIGVRGERVIQRGASGNGQQPDDDQRKQDTRERLRLRSAWKRFRWPATSDRERRERQQ